MEVILKMLKKVLLHYIGIIVILMFCVSCKNAGGLDISIELFIFTDDEAISEGYESLSSNGELVFNEENIIEYNWKTHEISLKNIISDSKKNKGSIFGDGGSTTLNTEGGDRCALVVNGEILYTGYFEQSMISSFYPTGVVVKDIQNGILIDFIKVSGSEDVDPRSNEKLNNALEKLNLLKTN